MVCEGFLSAQYTPDARKGLDYTVHSLCIDGVLPNREFLESCQNW